MDVIEVKTLTTYAARDAVKAIIDGIGGQDYVMSVILNTKEQVPDSFEDSENWPVRFQCTSDRGELAEFEIRVLMMTSGYSGTGPHDLVDILVHAGFDFDKNRIFSETINEKWTKDE